MPAATSPTHGPELFFGIAGAVGTDLAMVTAVLKELLEERRYAPREIQLSGLLDDVDFAGAAKKPSIDDTTLDRHIWTRMDAGDDLRELTSRGDALALLAIFRVLSLRAHPQHPEPRTAYIFRSLKHPKEVDSLREVYGPNFFLISAYSPVEARAAYLETRITRDWERQVDAPGDKSPAGMARDLIQRDMREADRQLGQRLGDTFAKADFFVDARDRAVLRSDLRRFIELLFDHPFHTPTRHENAMFHAQAAALRSSAPGRQVGCALTTPEGDVIVLGTNEVPKAGGGQYWPGDEPDKRDHEHDEPDVSGSHERTVIQQILGRLRDRGWLAEERRSATPDDFDALLGGLRVQSLIEFERAVHAEMAAIVLAARRGVSVQDAFLYTTTFPCHECTRHIIAAGIRRVFYIEPYPKSLASDLHPDSIVIDPNEPLADKVSFLPFVGVAPRRYLELFTPSPAARKDESRQVAPAEAGWLPKGVPSAEPPESAEIAASSEPEGVEEVEPAVTVSETPDVGIGIGADAALEGADHSGEGTSEEMAPQPGDETIAEADTSDLSEESGSGLAPPDGLIEHTSDALYILREGNVLVELEDALSAGGLELREESSG